MSQQETPIILAMCAEFFEESLHFNLTLYSIAKWAFLLAIALIVIQAAVAVWKAIKTPPPSASDAEMALNAGGSASITDILKALPALIDSLGKAPGAIVLIILGLMLVWIPTVDAPDVCEGHLAAEEESQKRQQEDPADT